MSKPLIGKILDGEREYERDAIHVPIIAVFASQYLNPGEGIELKFIGGVWLARKSNYPVGVVDPFLKEAANRGDKFWCFVKPCTVQKLWHEWRHPVFDKGIE